MITFDVYGTPKGKGNAKARVVDGRAVLASFGFGASAKALREWEAIVRAYARAELDGRPPLFVGQAVLLVITFFLPRPASHYGTGRNAGVLRASSPAYPISKPDYDKLARSTSDALTAIVWDDDSRVVEALIRKRFAPIGEEPGATIVVDAMPPPATLHERHG